MIGFIFAVDLMQVYQAPVLLLSHLPPHCEQMSTVKTTCMMAHPNTVKAAQLYWYSFQTANQIQGRYAACPIAFPLFIVVSESYVIY